MIDSYNELREEYYTALQGSITLNAATVNVYDVVKADEDTPFIYFADFDFKEDSCKDNFNGVATITLMVITKYTNAVGGSADSDNIGSQILKLLHNDTYFTSDNFRVVTNKLIDNSTDKVPTKTGTRIVKTIVLEHYLAQISGDLTRVTDLTAADNGATQIDLTWSRVTGNAGYRVEYTNNIDNGWSLLVTNATDTESYSHTGVTTDLIYYYRVRAFDSSGGSGWSNIVAERTEAGGISASGIAYQRPQLTGQTTSYRTGDDGWHLANGTYDYTPPIYPISYAELDTFKTLISNNAFGNKNRFTDENGLQVFGGGYIIDHYTGLGIAQARGFGSWDDMIDQTNSYVHPLGFSDFRIANAQEIASIYDTENFGFNYSPLTIYWVYSANYYHSSTTEKFNTNNVYKANREHLAYAIAKASSSFGLRVRNHYT